MFVFLIFVIVIIGVLTFEQFKRMKKELNIHKNMILFMRDKIIALEKTTDQLRKAHQQAREENQPSQQIKTKDLTQPEHADIPNFQEHPTDESGVMKQPVNELIASENEASSVPFGPGQKTDQPDIPLKFTEPAPSQTLETKSPLPPKELINGDDVMVSKTNTDHLVLPVEEKEKEQITVAKETASADSALSVKHQPLIFPIEQPIREEKKPRFNFNSENWVGVNLLNRLGALLIVIGAVATAAFDGIPSWIRTMILFAFAASVIVLGEVMNRKKATTASLGVTAVGVALVYVAVATSFFVLGTLTMYPALIACVLATVLGIYLAVRNDAQVVACFALVGGYLPIFALDPFNDALTIGLVVYFVLLSTYSLALALSKKWVISNFIGLGLTIGGTIYLGVYAAPLIAFIYACFAFMVYTLLPLISAYKTDKNFNHADVALVITNAFISSIVVFLIATRLDLAYVHTYLSAVFALTYLGLALLVKRVFNHKNMMTIFALKAVGFSVLFVPFTFNWQWFAIAWLIEGVVLSSYGILRKQKLAEYSGHGIFAMALVSFFVNAIAISFQFSLDYTFFTTGILVILAMYIIKKRQFSDYAQVYKWGALLNVWIYALYMLGRYLPNTMYAWSIYGAVSLLFSWLFVKVKIIADKGSYIVANVIHFTSLIMLWTSFFLAGDFDFETVNMGVLLLNLSLTIVSVIMVLHYQLTVEHNKWVTAYKNINLINIWLVFMWLVLQIVSVQIEVITLEVQGYILALLTFISLCVTGVYLKVKILINPALRIIINVIHGISLIMLFSSMTAFGDFIWRVNQGYFGVLLNVALAFLLVGSVVYYKTTEKTNKWVTAYKNINLFYLWVFVIFAISIITDHTLDWQYVPIMALVTFIMATAYVKIKLLSDKFSHVIANVIHGIMLIVLWVYNDEFTWFTGGNHVRLISNLLLTCISFALIIYYKQKIANGKWITAYQNINALNIWLTVLYVFDAIMANFEGRPLVLIIITFLLVMAAGRTPYFKDKGAKIISILMQITGLLWLATFNLSIYHAMFAMLSLNAVAQILALITLSDLIKHLKNKHGEETPFKVLILSGYFLLVITQGIMIQGQIAFTSAIISILFGITALAWIILGFYLKNHQIRKFGLYLAVASAVKLLVVDTWGLATSMRIISYLILGVVLMIISFVYQKFNTQQSSNVTTPQALEKEDENNT